MNKELNRLSVKIDIRFITDVILSFFGLAIAAIYYLDLRSINEVVVSYLIISLSLYACIVVRKNRLLLLLFGIILYANFSICYVNYIKPIEGILVTSLAETTEAKIALLYLLMFISVLVGFLPKKVRSFSYKSPSFTGYKNNTYITVLLVIVLVLICMFGFIRPDSLGAERGNSSALYEYSVILFILAFYFSNKKKWLTNLILVILVLYVFQDIAYGGRITSIQLLLVAFFFVFNSKTKTSTLALVVFCMLIFFLAFGGVRTQIWVDGFAALFESFQRIMDTGFAWDTAYSAWHTSITFLQFDSLISFSDHMYYLGQWLLSLVVGGSFVIDSNIASVTHLYFAHSFGGVLPIYLAFYFGTPGVIAIALLVSIFVMVVNRFCGGLNLDFGIGKSALTLAMFYFIITVPRWYLYSPSPLIRGLVLMLAVSLVTLFIDLIFTKKRTNKLNNCLRRASKQIQ